MTVRIEVTLLSRWVPYSILLLKSGVPVLSDRKIDKTQDRQIHKVILKSRDVPILDNLF